MTKLNSSLLLSLYVITFTGLAYLPRAQACSGPLTGMIISRQVLPADGSTSVPTNVRIYVAYNSYSPGVTDQPRLQTMDGKDVAVNLLQPLNNPSGNTLNQTFMLVPNAPLQPNTKYRILSQFGQVPCLQDSTMAGHSSTPLCTQVVDGGLTLSGVDGGSAATAVIAGFTTGAGPDDVAPVLTGSLTYAPAYPMSCSSSACCGPYEGWDSTFSWTKATDTGPVLYELMLERNAILLPLQSTVVDPTGTGTPTVRGIFLCSGSVGAPPIMLENAQFVGSSGLYTLYALDLAGNRSQPLQAQVTVDCGGGIDGGIDGIGSPDVPQDLSPLDTNGTGGATTIPGTGGATVVTGEGGAPGSGGGTGAPLTTGTHTDGSANDTISPDSGCSCRIGSSRNGGTGVALLAFGMLLARRMRRRR